MKMFTESGQNGTVPEKPGPKMHSPKRPGSERPTLKSKKIPINCVGVRWALKGLAVCVF